MWARCRPFVANGGIRSTARAAGEHDERAQMSLQTIVLATLITAIGGAQYALMVHAIRDLIRRPRVRGGNKVSWGLAILCVPIAGALIYGWMGPTSFIRRGSMPHMDIIGRESDPTSRPAPPVRSAGLSTPARSATDPYRNITPIRRTRPSVKTQRPATRPASAPSRIRHTGS
jgi:hypothetical protein